MLDIFNDYMKELDNMFSYDLRVYPKKLNNGTFAAFPMADINKMYRTSESDEFYEISMAIPGIKKEDISLTINQDTLKLRCSTKNEFVTSEISQSWPLQSNADKEKISASCEDGIMRIKIPKTESKEIAIQVD